jgi:hypothetical protein
MATTNDGELQVSSGAQAAIGRAVDVLRPYRNEPRVDGLLGKLEAIQSPDDFGDGDELAKAMVACDRIAKSEDLSPELRERGRKAGMACQLEYLAKSNPMASQAWENSWGVIHGMDRVA